MERSREEARGKGQTQLTRVLEDAILKYKNLESESASHRIQRYAELYHEIKSSRQNGLAPAPRPNETIGAKTKGLGEWKGSSYSLLRKPDGTYWLIQGASPPTQLTKNLPRLQHLIENENEAATFRQVMNSQDYRWQFVSMLEVTPGDIIYNSNAESTDFYWQEAIARQDAISALRQVLRLSRVDRNLARNIATHVATNLSFCQPDALPIMGKVIRLFYDLQTEEEKKRESRSDGGDPLRTAWEKILQARLEQDPKLSRISQILVSENLNESQKAVELTRIALDFEEGLELLELVGRYAERSHSSSMDGFYQGFPLATAIESLQFTSPEAEQIFLDVLIFEADHFLEMYGHRSSESYRVEALRELATKPLRDAFGGSVIA